MNLALQHPENRLLIKPEVTKCPILSHSKIPSSSLNVAVALFSCVCLFFLATFPLPNPHPIIFPAIQLHVSFATAEGWETAFPRETCDAEQGVCRFPSFTKLGGCFGRGRRQLKECPSFAWVICPRLGGGRYFRFWRLFLCTIRVLLFLVGLFLSLAGNGVFSSVASYFLLGCSRVSRSSKVFFFTNTF